MASPLKKYWVIVTGKAMDMATAMAMVMDTQKKLKRKRSSRVILMKTLMDDTV